MIIRLSLVVLCAALVVSPALSKDKVKSGPEQMACAGVFGPDSSEALLKQTYGADNVVTGQVYGAEGMEMLATILFPDDPQRMMQFGWMDKNSLSGLAYVDLAPSQTAPGGVRLGMTVAEVVALNGEDFDIGGFWWDYGGYANVESGALASLPGGCYLSLRFSPAEEYSEDLDTTPVAGEVRVPTSEPLLAKLDVRVSVLSLGYPYPEAD